MVSLSASSSAGISLPWAKTSSMLDVVRRKIDVCFVFFVKNVIFVPHI